MVRVPAVKFPGLPVLPAECPVVKPGADTTRCCIMLQGHRCIGEGLCIILVYKAKSCEFPFIAVKIAVMIFITAYKV